MVNNIKLFLVGIRYKNIMIALICCLIAIAKFNISDYSSIFLPIIIVLLLMIVSNLSNDIFDIETDSINNPNRPLITHPSIIYLFKITIIISCVLVLIGSFFINFWAQCIAVGSIPLLISYSKFFKPAPLLGNIFVAFYLALVFIFIEIAITNSINIMIVPSIFAFGISLIREIIKDIEDYKGDAVSKINTLPIFVGIKGSIYIVISLIICFLLIYSSIIVQYLYFYYSMSLFFLVFLPLFYLIFFLVRNPTSKACGEASALLKKTTILGLLIIYII